MVEAAPQAPLPDQVGHLAFRLLHWPGTAGGSLSLPLARETSTSDRVPKCQRPAPRNAQEVGVTGQQGNVEPASRVVPTAGERQQCPPQGRDLSSRGCQVGTEFRASLERAGDKTVGPTSARAPQHSCLKGDPRLRAFAGCTGPEPRGPESSFANNSKSCPYPTAQEPPILKGPAPRQGADVWVSSSVGAGCLEATPMHLRLLDKPRRGGAA